ncbi:hypothetical protein FE782_03655 [Paenibacillus antri]|uniref:TrbC/VirB2 family protein n=1 Tax=Paenibacillus antri TaxID=2582848 RepID=A0A5R9GAA6_9BACL|nr:hypothetical protein [Paenibacillus antri]TLS53377.1 hypothetical protein FE782_03655 [Paenibacillus antri]
MVTVTIGAKGGVRTEVFRNVATSQLLPAAIGKNAAVIDRKRLNDPKVKPLLEFGVPAALLWPLFKPVKAYAFSAPVDAVAAMAVPDAVKSKILHAFDPLIDLIVALSYPVAGVIIAGGCLFILCGGREQGMKMLQNAAIGYILVQLSPLMLDLLVGIGENL